MYNIPNDDIKNYPFFKLQLVVEMFGHSTKLTNQSKYIKVPKVVWPTNINEYENIIIKLCGPV